jgi:hypothetical protein
MEWTGNRAEMRRGAKAVLATAGAWFVVHVPIALVRGLNPLHNSTWGRWDSGLYLIIARSGYRLERCVGVHGRSPSDWCGTTGWFPGYPYAVRVMSWTGIGFDNAARVVALGAFLLTLSALWWGFVRHLPPRTAVLVLAGVVVFPASIYFGATFPVSMVVLSLITADAVLQRGRWLVAGLAGTLAVVAYPSGILVAAMALVPLLSPRCTTWPQRLRATAATVVPPLVAYGLVLLNFQRAVGRWNAWMLLQAGYGYSPSAPWSTLWRQMQRLWAGDWTIWIGLQSLWVLVMVVALTVVVTRSWSTLDDGRRAAAVVGFVMWLAPLTLGGSLSLHRAESLLLPTVILYPLLPRRFLIGALVVALPITVGVSYAYFRGVLV